MQLVRIFSSRSKDFPGGKKNCIVSQRECSFSLCFHFPSRDVILTLVHDRVSFESIIVEVCVYIYILLLLLLIQMLSSIIQICQGTR